MFNFAAEKDLALQLVERLVRDMPPALMEVKSKALSVNKITRMLERTLKLAIDYNSQRKIGFIRRAVLANHFKWALKNRGYADGFIDVATEGLVVALTTGKITSAGDDR